MSTWAVAVPVALAVSAVGSVTLGRMISHADRLENTAPCDIWCTGCGLPTLDRRARSDAACAQPGWSHGVDEDYCPDCTETRHATWGYRQ